MVDVIAPENDKVVAAKDDGLRTVSARVGRIDSSSTRLCLVDLGHELKVIGLQDLVTVFSHRDLDTIFVDDAGELHVEVVDFGARRDLVDDEERVDLATDGDEEVRDHCLLVWMTHDQIDEISP